MRQDAIKGMRNSSLIVTAAIPLFGAMLGRGGPTAPAAYRSGADNVAGIGTSFDEQDVLQRHTSAEEPLGSVRNELLKRDDLA